MTFLDHLNSPKCDFTQNRSGSKIINFQQSQALTLHFGFFWSIVHSVHIFMNNVFVYKYSEKVDVNGNAFGPKQNRGWGFCDPRCEYFSVEQNKMTTWDGLNDFLAWYEETLGRPFEVQTEGCPTPGTTTTTT